MLKSKGLTERQRIIIGCMRMRLTEKQSLIYLEKEHGIKLGGSTYRRDKTKIKRMTRQRLYHIAEIGYEDQHMGAIDETENAIMLMYREYLRETEPLKRVQILEKIINLKPLLSNYYDATQGVIQNPEHEPEEDQSIQEPEPTTNDSWV